MTVKKFKELLASWPETTKGKENMVWIGSKSGIHHLLTAPIDLHNGDLYLCNMEQMTSTLPALAKKIIDWESQIPKDFDKDYVGFHATIGELIEFKNFITSK